MRAITLITSVLFQVFLLNAQNTLNHEETCPRTSIDNIDSNEKCADIICKQTITAENCSITAANWNIRMQHQKNDTVLMIKKPNCRIYNYYGEPIVTNLGDFGRTAGDVVKRYGEPIAINLGDFGRLIQTTAGDVVKRSGEFAGITVNLVGTLNSPLQRVPLIKYPSKFFSTFLSGFKTGVQQATVNTSKSLQKYDDSSDYHKRVYGHDWLLRSKEENGKSAKSPKQEKPKDTKDNSADEKGEKKDE